MKASVSEQNEDHIRIDVSDNNDFYHDIVIEKDTGEITFHDSDGYPDDPNDRTREQQETVFHARRYAKYHVAQETEYDTLPWDLNPDRFEAVRGALKELSDEEIESSFGELFEQSLSHYEDDPDVDIGDTVRPYELPADKIGDEGAVLYKQRIYLNEAGTLEAVSGLGITYYVARGERKTVWHGEDPLDREPDARVELLPAPLVDYAPFRDYMRHNLGCQIRDCYLMMGLEPPAEYKVLGFGQYRFAGKYDSFDMYPEYFDKDAEIPGYSFEFRPELPISWEEVGGMMGSDESLVDRVMRSVFSR